MGDSIVGKVFQNIDDGTAFVEKYCTDGFHPVKHASRRTIAQYNNQIRAADRIVDLPGDAVYSVR